MPEIRPELKKEILKLSNYKKGMRSLLFMHTVVAERPAEIAPNSVTGAGGKKRAWVRE